ncbi:hypothetical protein HDU96_004567 [Phlyctochytrium bullatum]|nr:hypothetical protein HDU96_004567 [Phlyctochytrium bullatum]
MASADSARKQSIVSFKRRGSFATTEDGNEAPDADERSNMLLSKKRRCFAVPVWVVLGIVMAAAIIGIVVPIALTLVKTSRVALGDLAEIALKSAVQKALVGISRNLNQTAKVLDDLNTLQYFRRDYVANRQNMLQSPTLSRGILASLKSFSHVSSLSCFSNWNASNANPVGPASAQSHFQAVSGSFTDLGGGDRVGLMYTGYAYAQKSLQTYWVDAALGSVMDQAKVSDRGVVLLLERSTGLLVVTRPKPNSSPESLVSTFGAGLLSYYSNDLSSATFRADQVITTSLSDGNSWRFSASALTIRGTDFVVGVGFPFSDITSKADTGTALNGIIMVVGVGVAGILLTGGMTYLALKPLHEIALQMACLTDMDFSTIGQDTFHKRSFLREIREIQSVFATLVAAFTLAWKKIQKHVDRLNCRWGTESSRRLRRGGGEQTEEVKEKTIEMLAAERMNGKNKETLGFAIPVWLLLTFLMTGLMAAILVPLITTIRSNTFQSVQDMTFTTMQLAVTLASLGIESAISTTALLLDQLYRHPYYWADFTQNVGNVYASPTLITAMLVSSKSEEYLSALVCNNWGPAAIGPYGPFSNNTNVQALYTNFLNPPNVTTKAPVSVYSDPSTKALTVLIMYDNDLNVLRTLSMGPKKVQPKSDIIFYELNSTSPSRKPFFAITMVTSSGRAFWQMSYYRMFWHSEVEKPIIGCSIGYMIEEAFTPFLNSVKVTNRTIVLLIEKSSGLLMAANRPNSMAVNNTRVTPESSNNTDVSLIGRGLLANIGNVSVVSSQVILDKPLVQAKLDDGQEWFIGSKLLVVRDTEFVVTIAFPRSDFFENLDAADQRAFLIGVCVAVGGTAFTGLMAFLALWQLHAVAENMKKMTKFDFSAFENGALEGRSPMAEIKELQDAFDNMVVSFSSTIRGQKDLVNLITGGSEPNSRRESMATPSVVTSGVSTSMSLGRGLKSSTRGETSTIDSLRKESAIGSRTGNAGGG